MALLDALLRIQKDLQCEIEVVHCDHGWRSTSAAEAEQLRQWVAARGIPFHLETLQPVLEGNLEDGARQQRLRCFRRLMQERGARAILLGHQADDVVETTLKRVLEGARIDRLHGLRPVHVVDGVALWRPLLACERSEIERYCARRELPVVRDPTNDDPRFLRARMRRQLLPELERLFGKGVRRPLRQLAEQSRRLEERAVVQDKP